MSSSRAHPLSLSSLSQAWPNKGSFPAPADCPHTQHGEPAVAWNIHLRAEGVAKSPGTPGSSELTGLKKSLCLRCACKRRSRRSHGGPFPLGFWSQEARYLTWGSMRPQRVQIHPGRVLAGYRSRRERLRIGEGPACQELQRSGWRDLRPCIEQYMQVYSSGQAEGVSVPGEVPGTEANPKK